MNKIFEVYEKQDKNGNVYFVGDYGSNTIMLFPVKEKLPNGPTYEAYEREKTPHRKSRGFEDRSSNELHSD